MTLHELATRAEQAGPDYADIMARAYVHAIACEGFHTDPDACARRMNTVIARLHDAGLAIVPLEPTPAMIDSFVSRALQVSVSGEGGWSEYARNQWKQMVAAALRARAKEGV